MSLTLSDAATYSASVLEHIFASSLSKSPTSQQVYKQYRFLTVLSLYQQDCRKINSNRKLSNRCFNCCFKFRAFFWNKILCFVFIGTSYQEHQAVIIVTQIAVTSCIIIDMYKALLITKIHKSFISTTWWLFKSVKTSI